MLIIVQSCSDEHVNTGIFVFLVKAGRDLPARRRCLHVVLSVSVSIKLDL